MAESTSYPQIPSTVWSGVWQILHDSPSRKIDDNVLSIELGVQRTAAKQYLKELQRLGLFAEDFSSTDLAKKWRQDGDDREVISQILEHAYPAELRELAPPEKLDREKISRWFVTQGLGAGAAQNKAATYMRIASGVSAVEPRKGSAERVPRSEKRQSPRPPKARQGEGSDDEASGTKGGVPGGGDSDNGKRDRGGSPGRPELAVNVQIHISADSSPEQIDAIFSAMRKYFDGRQPD